MLLPARLFARLSFVAVAVFAASCGGDDSRVTDSTTDTPEAVALTAPRAAGGAQIVAPPKVHDDVVAAPATHLVFSAQPMMTTAGVMMANVTVSALDVDDMIDTSYGGSVTLSFSGPGSFSSGTTTKSAVAGVATFDNLVINTAGTYTLAADSGSFTQVLSSSFTINAAAADHLTFSVQPTTSVSEATIPVSVAARDAFENVATSFMGQVTVALGNNPGGLGTLSGTTQVNALAGVATFSDLSVDKVATGYTMTAAASVPGAVSTAFDITPGAANHLVFFDQPTNAVAGVAISPAITVHALDNADNLDTNFAGLVGLAIGANPGGGTLTGGSQVNASAGVATFSGVSIDKVGTNYTLQTTSSIANSTSSQFNITPAGAASIAFLQQPTTATAGVAISPAVTVRALDAFGNLATSFTGAVTLSKASGPGTMSGTNTVNASAGVASFNDISFDLVGSYTLDADSGAMNAPDSSSFTITPAAAASLAFGQQPTNTSAGASITPAVTVRAFDAFGNLATGYNGMVTVSRASGPVATLNGTLTQTASGGVAAFGNLSINTPGSYTLGATDGTFTAPASSSFTISAGTAATLSFTTQPVSTTAGVTMANIVVTALDGVGNTATSFTGQVTLAVNTGPGALAGTTQVNASAGVATFSNVNINTAGSYTLLASATGPSSATSSSFTISAAAADHFAFGQQPTTTVAGASINPAVTVRALDQFNNLVTSFGGTVTIGHQTGAGTLGGTLMQAAVAGVATFSDLSINVTGSHTLRATGSLTMVDSSSFTITPAAAAAVNWVQNPTDQTAGVTIVPFPTVEVLDTFGNRKTDFVGNITVAKNSGPGAGVLSGTTSQAVSSGLATFNNLSLNKKGTYTLIASSGALTTDVSTSFKIDPAAAQDLVINQQPTSAVAGVAISPAITVEAQDQFGNVDDLFVGAISVSITTNPGGGTLSGTTSQLAILGTATFPDLSINKTGNGYRITFTATGKTPAQSNTFNITPAAPHHVSFSTQPSNAVAGVSISPSIVVHIRDQFDNIATQSTANVSLAINNNPGSATLGGTTTLAASAGVATFPGISLNKVGTGYTLDATSASITTATSSAFNITPAAPTHLVFNQQPTNAVAGVAISPSITVQALDAFDNVATQFTGNVVMTIGNNPGTSTLSGTTTRAAVAGVATFNNLSLNKTGTGYTLAAASTGLTGATSSAFNITSAAPTHLAYAVQPSQVVAGVSIAPAVMVNALDAFDNVATQFTGNITVGLQTNPGGSTLSGTLTQAAIAGTATFGNLSLNKAASGYRLRATATGLTLIDSNLFTVVPAAASVLVYTQNPTTVVAGFAISPSIVVQARDPFDNLATGYTSPVTLALGNNPGGSTLGGVLTVNAVAGVATFPSITLNKVGTGYTLVASGPTVTSVTSLGFNVTPAAANKLVFTVQPTDQLAGATITPAIQVVARDQFENLATGFSGAVTIAINNNPGGSNLLGTATRSAVSGVVTFNDLSLNRVGTGYTLSVTAANLMPATSAAFNIVSASADRLFFTVQPTTTVSGTAISPAVQVTVRDALGNVASSFTGNVTVAIFANPGNATLSGTATVAAIAGIATFSTLSLDKVGSGYTLIATGTGLQSTTSTTFNITPANAATLHFTVQPGDVVAGVAHVPSIQVTARDPAGNQATGFTGMVTLGIGNNPGGATLSGTLAQAAVSGVATFAGISLDKVGLGYTLTAASTGLPTATSGTFRVTPASADHIGFTVQPTSTPAGDPITPAVRVTAFDPFGNVSTQYTGNITVAIGTNPGGSTLSGTTTVAASSGVATFSTLSLDRASPGYTLTASAASLTGDTSTMFEITPSNASRLVFTVQPTNSVAGVAFSPDVRVEARDTSGNLDVSFNGMVSLAIGNNPGNATLMGTPMVMATAGVATFTGISLDKVGTGYTLVGAGSGLVSATSSAFNITPAAASQLVFATQPLSAVAGSFLAPPVRVEARDAFDNVDTAFTGQITVAIGANPGSATLSGTLQVAATAGVVNYADLSLDKVGTGYTLAASASGMTSVTSATFNITPAAATRLAFFVQPVNTPAGQFITPAVVVEAQDPFGNRAISFSGAITVALGSNPGPSTLSGSLSGPAINGARTFNDLMLDRAATGYTLTASSTSLASATSQSFDVLPGAATSLVFAVQPSDTVAGAAITPAIRVEVRDGSGNVVPTFTGNITLSIGTNPGNATLGGTVTLAATAGVALYNDVTLDHQGSGYRLNATGAGVSSAVSTAFNVTPAAAAKLVVSQQPTLTVAGQPITPAVQIAVEDDFGNRVPTFTGNISIALQANPGSGTLGGTTTAAASAGVASFANLTIDRAAAGYTLRATSTGLTMVDTAAFDVISGSATAITFTVQPTDVVAGAAFSPAIVVSVRDSQGNVDPTFAGNITLAISNNPGSATLAGTISVLVANGTATFDNVSLDKVGIDYTLAASAAGVPSATSSAFDVTPAPASTYVQTGLPANVAAATTQMVVFTAQDQFGNTATGYDGTANLTSTDPDFEGPATVTFVDGVAASVNLVFHTMGTQMVTLTDGTTASITATFDTNVMAVEAPTVRITTPSDGAEVGGNMVQITANGTVASAATVMKIEIFVDGTLLEEGDSVPFTATWDASGLAIGSDHTLQARLTDSEGNIAESAEVHVTISAAADDGCCSAGGDPTSPLALAGFVLGAVLLRRRKRARA